MRSDARPVNPRHRVDPPRRRSVQPHHPAVDLHHPLAPPHYRDRNRHRRAGKGRHRSIGPAIELAARPITVRNGAGAIDWPTLGMTRSTCATVVHTIAPSGATNDRTTSCALCAAAPRGSSATPHPSFAAPGSRAGPQSTSSAHRHDRRTDDDNRGSTGAPMNGTTGIGRRTSRPGGGTVVATRPTNAPRGATNDLFDLADDPGGRANDATTCAAITHTSTRNQLIPPNRSMCPQSETARGQKRSVARLRTQSSSPSTRQTLPVIPSRPAPAPGIIRA